MQYRQLGQGGPQVSVLAFGAWQLGDPAFWGPDQDADAEAAVRTAIEAGVNLFDTAEMYGKGEAERALGRVLGRQRDQVYIASKVSPEHCEPAQLRAACEASLRRLNTDRIDLYQIHWPFRQVPFEAAYAELVRLQDEGKIRYIGVSNFGEQDMEDWLSIGAAVSNQLGYNLLFRAIEYGIARACQRHKLGILVYMPLMQGLLSGRWQAVEEIPVMRRRTRHFSSHREAVMHGEPGCEALLMETVQQLHRFADAIGVPMATMALCWLLAQPGITSVLVGARHPAQITRNLRAADLDLGPAAIAQLNEITGPLKDCLGPNADMWQSGEKSRIR